MTRMRGMTPMTRMTPCLSTAPPGCPVIPRGSLARRPGGRYGPGWRRPSARRPPMGVDTEELVSSAERARSAPSGSDVPAEHRNEVLLVGRLAAPATVRTLPSGDQLLQFRVVVAREPRPGGGGPAGSRSPTVDTIDCVSWSGSVRRTASRWTPGDLVAVEGGLRRRFWRTAAAGPASRTEVEVRSARRLARAATAMRSPVTVLGGVARAVRPRRRGAAPNRCAAWV